MTTLATVPLDRNRIAVRAYYLWEDEGRPEGRHESHWLAAEAAEKRSEAARRAAVTRRAKQMAAPKAPAAALVASAALARSGLGSTARRATRGIH